MPGLKKFFKVETAVAGSLTAEEFLKLPKETLRRNDSVKSAQLAFCLDITDKIIYEKVNEKGGKSYGLTAQGSQRIDEEWDKIAI